MSLMLVRRGAADLLFGALPHMHRPTGGVLAPRGRETLHHPRDTPAFVPASAAQLFDTRAAKGIRHSPTDVSTTFVNPADSTSSCENRATSTRLETMSLRTDGKKELSTGEAETRMKYRDEASFAAAIRLLSLRADKSSLWITDGLFV